MPTYVVKFANLELSEIQKNDLAKGITEVHSKVTGANKFFAQVIFNHTKKGDHFMGGKIVKNSEIFIYGHIRLGRPASIKKKLITGLRNIIIKNTKVKNDNIWIYILDLTPKQMIEYGEILPKSGGEKKWFRELSSKLKKRLNKIDN